MVKKYSNNSIGISVQDYKLPSVVCVNKDVFEPPLIHKSLCRFVFIDVFLKYQKFNTF